MTEREQLIQEIEKMPDYLVHKILEILLEEKQKKSNIDQSKKLRPFGLCEGEFIVPDDFDEPLLKNIL
ncbi:MULTISPECIES: DUF2281 domain-containing protein [Cyanophyceae]|uniref:DUF2281 domain-containing protein n=1 Tax=Cyanophyceae TaxID=3028117 RepID=UPI00016DCB65|nr:MULTISPECIES: DUF2281 domain-containing protein [Cyanophyceae]ACB00293.1 conserved hypothetical protein [Picosynechococcus sp. PCC 7002]SMH52569.1 Protein of unknown function [Picosynechococcus sp. OG1]SMQ82345.1 Protein of unknown function [Synechococcus sp. 7002]